MDVTGNVQMGWCARVDRRYVTGMTIAVERDEARCEQFTSNGRSYAWREGERDPRGELLAARRAELPAVFAGVVLPGLERRGAERRVQGAGPRGGAARAQWVTWQARGDARPVWALYVPTRRLTGRALEGLGRPANDGVLLAAWGDGPVLAWASERPELRAALREALRALPGFLAEGLASGDPTLPLRIAAR